MMKNALVWVRAHKVQVGVLAVTVCGLAERYIPGFPADEVARVVGVALGLV